MLVPRFILTQDFATLTVTISARNCRISELDVEVDGNCFLFSCWPYFLRLSLPGSIVDNENSKSSFNSDSGEFTFQYDKAIEGEVFENLDLVTKFLVRKVEASYGESSEGEGDKIQIVSGDNIDEEDLLVDDFEHLLEYGFGFALKNSTHLKSSQVEYYDDVFEINPYKIKLSERRKLRLQKENSKFNPEHYMCDIIDSEEIEELMKSTAPWDNIDESNIKFTNKELDFLKDLPNKVHKLNDIQINYVHNSLVDILYAYCYNQRVTGYEENSEAGWNIVTLSASLSWLDVFETPRDTLIFAFRRSLIYPLYRNFKLSLKILDDLKKLLKLGQKYIIKCLIEIYYIFLSGSCGRFILNNLFIKDYISYVTNLDTEKLVSYLERLDEVQIKKSDLALNLIEIEQCLSEDLTTTDEESTDISSNSESEDERESDSDDVESNESDTSIDLSKQINKLSLEGSPAILPS